VRYGGGGTETIGICGSFKFENEVGNPIISLLPKLIHVPHSDTQTYLWLEPLLNGLAHEVQNPAAGSGSLINHLTGVMFELCHVDRFWTMMFGQHRLVRIEEGGKQIWLSS
jgi:hypothetical protein